jgi:predicted dehydrogenase
MSPSDQLRVAVIGCGQMGARHVSTYGRLEQAQLVAVADPSEAARASALAGVPVAEFDDWRRLLDQMAGGIDAVSIACPSNTHAEVAAAALDAGLHVLVEKPIATKLSDATRLIAAARRQNRKLMVGHIERFNPAIARLRVLVSEGRLGEIYRIHGTRVGPSPMRNLNAGVALDLATHDLDAMAFVLEKPLRDIMADGGCFEHGRHEDLVTCLLYFAGGTRGLLDVNWLSPEKQRELVLIGEGGMLKASFLTQDVWFIETNHSTSTWDELAVLRGEAEGSAVRFALRKVEPIRAELEAFLRCVIEDLPEPVSGIDGARALAAALAILESVATGARVEPVDIVEPAPIRLLEVA